MELNPSRHARIASALAIAVGLQAGGVTDAQTLGEIARRTSERGPDLRAIVSPPANAVGWHNTDVAVSFECRRTVVCADSVILSSNGAGQRITRSVVDDAGRSAHVDLTINIDKTPGTVRIESTESPDISRVWVRAHAYDAVSGVVSALCNGRPARLTEDRIECDVPLRDGITDVVVSTLDRAGNSASAGVQLSRGATSDTARVFPRATTLRVGDERPLQFVDSAWRRLERVSWSSDNPGVVSVDAARGTIAGQREGEATITGWGEDGRRASATVTVISAGEFPTGSTLWQSHAQPDSTGGRPLPEQGRVMSIEFTRQGDTYVQSLSILGEPAWITLAAIAPDERPRDRMIDNSGTPLLWVDSGHRRSAIVRTGRPQVGRVWRYELASSATGFWALGWDGTLWVVEAPDHGYPHVTALDHLTGEVKFRLGVPLSVTPTVAGQSAATASLIPRPSTVGPPLVRDGLEVAIPYAITEVGPAERDGAQPQVIAMRRVNILVITPEGQARTEGLLGFSAASVEMLPKLRLTGVRPDGRGGTLALMQAAYPDGRLQGWVMRRSGDHRTIYALPVAGAYVLGEDQAYTTDGTTMVAFDPVSGKVNWVRHSDEPFLMDFAVKDGGVLVHMKSGRYVFTSDGTVMKVSALTGK